MRKTDPVVEIDYKSLGTINIDELKQAIWEDIEALKDQFGVAYVTGVKLTVPATNEFGDPLQVKRLSTGATVIPIEQRAAAPLVSGVQGFRALDHDRCFDTGLRPQGRLRLSLGNPSTGADAAPEPARIARGSCEADG
jgi:hypothetical protein